MIDLFRVTMSPEAGPAVAKLYTPDTNGRTYVGQGPKTDEFEHAFARTIGVSLPPLGVNSCSAAIDLALHMIGVGPGDEVITTPITCSATNGSIVTRGATIVWADVGPESGLISPAAVARCVTPKTKAIIAVDWAGRACDYVALRKATGGRIPIIQDAAHCLYIGKARGDYTCWSFGPIKHLTTGGYGGALLPPPEQYARAKLLRWHGLDRDGPSESFRCIHPRTKIRVANGRAIPIRQMVVDKNPGPVLVYEDGHLVPRKIIGWHENPLGGRKYLRIALASLQGREAAIVTEDHLILTREGWKRADCLTEQDEVATAYPGESVSAWDKVLVTEMPRVSTRKMRNDSTSYCLTAEGDAQNFVAGPIVVHNCEQDIKEAGYRYHMTDDQAVVGLANLPAAKHAVDEARLNAWTYYAALNTSDDVSMPVFDNDCSYWLFGLLVDHRDEFMAMMTQMGVATSRVHARNDKHSAFKAASRTPEPLAGVLYFDTHQVNVPVGWWLSQSDTEQVLSAIQLSARLTSSGTLVEAW